MHPLTLTTSEAGYVLERPTLAINKAVDTGLIRADTRRGRAGQGTLRILGRPELRFLKLADELNKDLTPHWPAETLCGDPPPPRP